MLTPDIFKENITKRQVFPGNAKLLLAVSGGVDSVVLVDLCHKAGYPLAIAHCNFRLRGEESERDEQFVTALGNKYEAEIFVKHFDTAEYAKEHHQSIQVAARELRYQWFGELVKDMTTAEQPVYLLTAHHADDNIETLLMNFFKGTGINGLKGIHPKQDKLIRPLLFAGKQDILAYAEANQLSYVEDSSNQSDKYTRNFFRNQLLPAVKEVFPKAEENLKDNIIRFNDIHTIYTEAIEGYKKKLTVQKGNELHIPVLKLKKWPAAATLLYEIIKDYNFTALQSPEVMKLLESETGRFVQSSTHRIIRNRDWLIISPLAPEEAAHILIQESDKHIIFPQGKLTIEKISGSLEPSANPQVAALDTKDITFPLLLRKWKQGDYFYPLGMRKKKKLSRFFIDQKLSLTDKENVWVIESDKKIVWVVGLRIDDRFKLTPSSNSLLKMHIS
jgi:tRNA(Ile)-lysidine synthase